MTHEEATAVKACMTCNGSLENGYSWRGTERAGITFIMCHKCNDLDGIRNFGTDEYLNSSLMLTASLVGHEVKMGYDTPLHLMPELATLLQLALFGDWLNEQGKVFEKIFFTPKLRKWVEKHTGGGTSGKLNGVDVLVFTTAGRCLITLNTKKASLTFITVDGDEGIGMMNWQGVSGTRKDIRAMVDKVFRDETRVLTLTANKKVRILGT